jgi:hypothetical protein
MQASLAQALEDVHSVSLKLSSTWIRKRWTGARRLACPR